MGNTLANNLIREIPTNLLRAVKRKTRRFNAIPRAEKAVDEIQENPTRAPTHEATQKLVDQLLKEHPEKLNELSDKDENLHKNLESVYVKSTGENKEIFSRKRLPESCEYRMIRTKEPDQNVPAGRYNATRAEHFLAAHERDPKAYSAEILADVYKVDSNAMENILEYVKIYSVALPMKKTGEPGPMRMMAQDLMPGGLYEEPEIRVLERKVQLAKDKMAKLYKQQYKIPEKLNYDMTLFESLVSMKPMVKKFGQEVVDEIRGPLSEEEVKARESNEFYRKPESKEKTADVAEDISKNDEDISKNDEDNDFLEKTKKKLVKYGVLESQEEIREEKEAKKLHSRLKDRYVSPHESVAELTTISTPETEKEEHFAVQTQRKLENILLLEDSKKDDEKNEVKSESSSDSAETKDAQSNDSKVQFKKKMSDKG